jgi:hypothetical protein
MRLQDMKDRFKFPFVAPEHSTSGKYSTLLQVIIVLSSSILSSSVVATVAKAWLDNRKTKLTIQIDGSKKMLQYEGHHLNQDAATIQSVLDTLSKETTIATAVDVVTINVTDDGQKEAYRLAAGTHQSGPLRSGNTAQ